jgi:crotonobetainyl-CoA:carnitine CoA-transferase CaiB-like acyl-CoA transferase
VVGRPQWERFDTVAARIDARSEFEPGLEQAFRARTAVAWQMMLTDAGVPAEVSIDTNDGEIPLHDADNERLGLVAEYIHPTLGTMRQFGSLVDFSETPTGPFGPAPLLGQHTRPIMERLGYSGEEVDDLLARGVIYEPGEDYRWAL